MHDEIISREKMTQALVSVKTVSIRLPPDLKAWLDARVAKYGSSQSSEVIRLLRKEVEEQGCPAS